MIQQGACVDSFGVGERLITAASDPVFGGVYKLAAVEENGQVIPRIKVSENVTKITNPCFKKLWRLYDRDSGKAIADVITLNDETIDDTKPYEIFDPEHIWKRKRVENYTAVPLQEQLFRAGECVYDLPTVQDLQLLLPRRSAPCGTRSPLHENPHKYYVDLSQPLWDEKQRLLSEYSR